MNEDFLMKLNIYRERLKNYFKTRFYAIRTAETYLDSLNIFFTFLRQENISSLHEITKDTISKYQLYVYSRTTNQGKRITPTTQSHDLVAVRHFFKFLFKEGVVYSDPTQYIEYPKQNRRLPRNIPTEKEALLLLNQPDPDEPLGLRDKAILELLYSTGIRNTELRTLAIEDVNFENRVIRVHGKGGKDRVIPIGRIALGYLEEYIRHGRLRLIKKKEEKLLFVSNHGRMLDDSMPPHIVKKYAKKAKIKKYITTHSIRHAFATHILKGGSNIRYVQEMLGHESLQSTQIYTKVEISDLKKVHQKTHPREKGISCLE